MMWLFMTSKSLQMITTAMPFFYKKFPKKNVLQSLVTFWWQIIFCKKMASPWWLFVTFFEVMKSYITILSIDCNTHLHTFKGP